MKTQKKTAESHHEDEEENDHQNSISPIIAQLQRELNAIPLENSLKEQIKAKTNQINNKITEEIKNFPSIYDYFSKLLQTTNAKPKHHKKIARLINNANNDFCEKIRSNKVKYSENAQNLSILITDNYKGKKYEELVRKKQIKDANVMKHDLEKKLITLDLELGLLKAREFSTPNYKTEIKMPVEKQKDIDEFIKKKTNERKEIEKRRNDRITKMLEDMKKKEEDLKYREKILRESVNKEKLEKIQKNIDDIQLRMNSRDEETVAWKAALKDLYKKAPQDPNKRFEETQKALLEKTTQEKMKEKVKPMNQEEIKEFMKKHDEEIQLKKEQKLQELKEMRKQLKEKAKGFTNTVFHEKAEEAIQEKMKELQKIQEYIEEKKKRVEDYEKRRKEHYLPVIDEEKKQQIQKEISKLNNHKIKRLISKKHEDAHPLEEWDPREADAMDPKVKGREYLEYVRGLKKKEPGTKSEDNISRIDDKTKSVMSENKEKGKNYMKDVRGILAKKNDLRSLKNVIEDTSISENVKRDQIKIQAAFWEEKARMKEEGLKYNLKNKNEKKKRGDVEDNKNEIDDINELYLNSIKAKLALFKGA